MNDTTYLNLKDVIKECRDVYYYHETSTTGLKFKIKTIKNQKCLIIKGTSSIFELKYSLNCKLEKNNDNNYYHSGYIKACEDLTKCIGIIEFDYVLGHSLGAVVAYLYKHTHNLSSIVVGLCPPRFCFPNQEDNDNTKDTLFVTTSLDPCNFLWWRHYPLNSKLLIRFPIGIPHLTYTLEYTFKDMLEYNIQDLVF